MKTIYLLEDGHGRLKIGIASNITQRMPAIKNGCSEGIERVFVSRSLENAKQIERMAHEFFSASRTSGEWFKANVGDAISYFKEIHKLDFAEHRPNPRGAPKKEAPASDRFEVRCTPEQKQRWSAAAARLGFSSLAAWLKHLADKNAE